MMGGPSGFFVLDLRVDISFRREALTLDHFLGFGVNALSTVC